MGNKTYVVLYKSGKTQNVVGSIVFFSSMNTEVPRFPNAVYLNADEVVSVVEKSTDSGEEV